LVLLSSTIATAAEITVLSGGAIEPGLKAAAAAFEKQSSHTVKITFNTTPQMTKRLEGGDTFDVVIAPPATADQFVKSGKLESRGVNVGRVRFAGGEEALRGCGDRIELVIPANAGIHFDV
jgi:molybdate transport system substrate-binding protein